ncbi:MAG: hypothetical protein ABI894_06885 [Ilumatobacteraceae bacterium]
MAGKRSILSKAKLATGAAVVLRQVLAHEEVRKVLANAPRDVISWASKKRLERRSSESAGRFDPTQRFGHRGLERRIRSLDGVTERAFPNRTDLGRAELTEAIGRVSLALEVAEQMPLVRRRRAQARISKQLDEMESTIVNAVLPK